RLGVTDDHVSPERLIERGHQHAMVATGVHQRHRAHRERAGAVGVEPLALAQIELACRVYERPRPLQRGAPLVATLLSRSFLQWNLAARAACAAASRGSFGGATPSQSSIAARACPTSIPSPPSARRPAARARW